MATRRHTIQLRIGTWITLGSLAVLLPLLVFVALLLHWEIEERRQSEREAIDRSAHATANAIGHELDGLVAMLRAMAQSESMHSGDFRASHATASRMATGDPRIRAISLGEVSGIQVFSTDRPYGAQLPLSLETEAQRTVIASGKPAVSPLLRGRLTGGQLFFGVVMPTSVGGQEGYALRASASPQVIQHIVDRQQWPTTLTVAVVDQRRQIVARSHDAPKYMGTLVTPSLARNIELGLSQFTAATKDGQYVQVSAAPVPGTSWHVVVGQPLTELAAQAEQPVWLLIAVATLCIGVSVGAAQQFGRHLGAQFARVASAHATNADARVPDSWVREANELAQALRESQSELTSATSAWRQARLDALTGLPARAQFFEDAHARAREAMQADHLVAVLYADLDGFKAVNDRLGHDAGDQVLIQAAQAIRASVRASDVVGRMGGDEFVIMIHAAPDAIERAATGIARTVLTGVASIGQGMACSVGIACGPATNDLHELIIAADQAMLKAKQQGKNRFVVAPRSRAT